MSERVTGGDVVAAFFEACGVRAAFGVISIHNMPILDALMRRGVVRCIAARGEAGAASMADAYARVRGGIGVAVTSTGTAAGNACGALVEAQTAGTPVVHVTGQIETPYLDRERGYIHEARDQFTMLRAVSKRAYRVWSPETLLGTLRDAVATALAPPRGPVSIEIPIDVQSAAVSMPPLEELLPPPAAPPVVDVRALEALARELRRARRPVIWLGGGAKEAVAAVGALAALGFAVISSTNGRGILPEDDPMSLGSFTTAPAVEELFGTCDALLVVGSRLRGNETLQWKLRLPERIYQIDVNPSARDRSYATKRFVAGDARAALEGLTALLEPPNIDPAFHADVASARDRADDALRRTLGPYEDVVHALRAWMPPDATWVRDVTVSNSTWGNRYVTLRSARAGVHALGGGIGMGLPMAIGAALGGTGKTIALVGDGGLQLSFGELATLVQEDADVLLLVMNDRGYGVIRNIQDHVFGGRHYLADLLTPDLQAIAAAIGLPSARAHDTDSFVVALRMLGSRRGPALLEVDMVAFGPYASAFAGPPVRESARA